MLFVSDRIGDRQHHLEKHFAGYDHLGRGCMHKQPVETSISELAELLDNYLAAAGRLNYAIKISGHPGIGKSSVVQQAASRNQFLFIDTRLAFKENIDLGGYPVPDHNDQKMVYFRPRFIPPETLPPSCKGVLWFLDEANRAHPTVIQTLFQIITEHRCGEHRLPERTAIVLAGNSGESDGTTITEFDDAALDGRLALFHLKPAAKDWLKWAASAGIHPAVLQYIALFPEKLWDEQNIHPNPRGWHQVSQAITLSYGLADEAALTRHFVEKPGSALEKLIASLVGDMAAFDLIRQLTAPRTITTSDILSGNETSRKGVSEGTLPAEDVLWAITGAIGQLRQQAAVANGTLDAAALAQFGHILSFIVVSRADTRIAFFHLILRECGLLTRIPDAVATLQDTACADAILTRFGELFS